MWGKDGTVGEQDVCEHFYQFNSFIYSDHRLVTSVTTLFYVQYAILTIVYKMYNVKDNIFNRSIIWLKIKFSSSNDFLLKRHDVLINSKLLVVNTRNT